MILERVTAQRTSIRSMARQGVQVLQGRTRPDPHHLLPPLGLVHVPSEQMLAQLVLDEGGDVPQKEGAGVISMTVILRIRSLLTGCG